VKWLATMKWTIGTAALASLFVGVFSLLPDHEAHAQATACFDFTTGGGWFQSSFGDGKANFGFNVGYKNGPDSPLRGEFNLVDHAANVTIKALTIDTYGGEGNGTGHRCSPNQSCDRFWTGTAEITFPDAVFVCSLVVEVVDRGSNDSIHVACLDYTGFAFELPAGNIEVHKAACL
jgi:hypothetical protein